jgi:alkyldihydroxyacetonephosphate synthase
LIRGEPTALRSRSSLSREEIRRALASLVSEQQICFDEGELRRASVDRFKKYMTVNGIFSGPVPAAIVWAESTDDVAKVLSFANEYQVNVVARTGGSGTEGGLETIVEDSVVLDGSRMNEIVGIDRRNMMVTARCGVLLEDLEAGVRAEGLTTGHSPQSRPLARMGGLTATRSIGQLSTLYGGIEELIVGLEAVFPNGAVCRIKNVPRRAAGPDIRHVVIGNEGALCFVTEVTLKLFRYAPENDVYLGFLVDDFDAGVEIIREVVTAGFRPAVCRLYSEEDASAYFSDVQQGKCVLIFISQGPKGIVDATTSEIERVVDRYPHEGLDAALIARWFANLNWYPRDIEAERETMRSEHWLGYTTEISANWSDVATIYRSVMRRIRTEFDRAADLTRLGAHSSHSYQTGTNLYFVYDYQVNCPPELEISTYHVPINAIIVEEALKYGGSMVHQHGIGKYRTDWTEEEHGSAYYLLRTLKDAFDPNGVMNAGTIFKA